MLKILGNIIPQDMIDELKNGVFPQPQLNANAVVMFTDFSGFTSISKELGPDESISQLNQIFSAFDEIVAHFNLERVKTIGDAYMAVGGINTKHDQMETMSVLTGLKMQEFLNVYRSKHKNAEWKLRVGAHTGDVMSGIIGHQRIAFDVWGDTVNIAARLESLADKIGMTVSEKLAKSLSGIKMSSRGSQELHNWGEMVVYDCEGIDLDSISPELADQYQSLDVERLADSTQVSSGVLQTLFNV
jgi:class 3 adenylate cyclase